MQRCLNAKQWGEAFVQNVAGLSFCSRAGKRFKISIKQLTQELPLTGSRTKNTRHAFDRTDFWEFHNRLRAGRDLDGTGMSKRHLKMQKVRALERAAEFQVFFILDVGKISA